MENIDSFNLFIDLDDVLIASHEDMNKDLVKAYGKEYDWANTVDAQKHFDEHLKALLAKHGDRAKFAAEQIQQIRNIFQRYGMSYELMSDMFKVINTYAFDINYDDDMNDDFHDHLNRMSKYFILKERLLDARDTKLFQDNQISDGTHAVHYENYYTQARLLASPVDRDKPQVVDALSKSGEFEGTIKILSHYNGPNEGDAKDDFCKVCYPTAEFMPLFFHENNQFDKYFRRPRYSKARYVSEQGYDIRKSILIDDSMDNINAWVTAGGIGIVYDIRNKYHDNDKYYVIHNFTYDEIMNVVNRIKADYQYKNGKVLYKKTTI